MAMQKYVVVVGIALLLSVHVISNLQYAQADTIILPTGELSALNDMFVDWSRNTKDVNSSLPGWQKLDPFNTTAEPCWFDFWRGVFCYMAHDHPNITSVAGVNYTTWVWRAAVVDLTISDASIIGTLPPTMWSFSYLITLTLSGNPGLTGPIPAPTLGTVTNALWTLKNLDLHGNGLSGSIPTEIFENSEAIEDVNLSNNHLDGELPSSLGLNKRLRILDISNNNLTGPMPSNISGNWTSLVKVDFSRNKFTGGIPNLVPARSLHTLNISHNEFGGNIDPLLTVLNPGTYQSLAMLDLSDNNFTGPLPSLGSWLDLQSLNLSYNKFDAGEIPSWLSSLTNIQTLALSSTSLKGELDLSMVNSLTQLSTLELDDNNISGTLHIGNLHLYNGSLRIINLRNNQIGNVIVNVNISALAINFNLRGNPYCNYSKATDTTRCLCEQLCYVTPKADSTQAVIIGCAVGGSLGAIMMIIAAMLYWKNRKDRRYLLLTVHEKFAEYEMKPTLFTYSELQKATRDFHPDMKLGEGGFGAVYKGNLADRSVVAVKQLLPKAQQSMDNFLNEVILLTTVKHRNLVKLKGCCLRGDRRLLVYEYVDNYDLAEILFEHKGNQLVTWPARFNICLGVAHGLHYLHAGVDPKIIHRDIKASNILLDSNLQPKIADFGLAMLYPNEDTHITIVQIAGTKGYLAPEYATLGQLSEKIDVFSFGVLALEVVSGRKNISFDVPLSHTYLTDWAWKLNDTSRLMDLVDPTLSIQLDEEVVVQRVINTALVCIQTAAERRPSMAQVVGMLQGDIEIGESVKARSSEHVIKSHHKLLGLSNSATTLVPVHENTEALHIGESSSSGMGAQALELGAVRAR